MTAQNVNWKTPGSSGLVVAGKKEAVEAGVQILANGGNAVDAAVASTLVLSVTHIGAFCIGGEVPFIVYDAAKNEVKVLSGQGAAPLDKKAMEWYYENGIPGSDIKAAAVPAVIDLCVTALKMYGTISFAEAAAPVLEILDAGAPNWYRDTAGGDTIDGISGQKINNISRATPPEKRSWYSELALTLRKLIEAEEHKSGSRGEKLQAVSDRFYRGDIADELERWYIEKGGFLRKKDLAAHRTRVEEAVKIDYRGFVVYKCNTWTQGPYLLQALRLLEGFDLKKMGFLSADYIHLVVEAMKLALADRDEYYADPNFADVPLQKLLSAQYTQIRRPLVDMQKASLEVRPGDPLNMKPLKTIPKPSKGVGGTTTLCVADRWGNVVAATPSGLGSDAGSGGATGFTHGTRLQSLNTWKDHPNRIQPGKRPRITLTPTLVLKDGKPLLAISIAGGDLQDQVALQLLLNHVEFALLPEEALKAPRFATGHHTGSFGQDFPRLGSLRLQNGVPQSVIDELTRRGHHLQLTSRGIGGAAMLFLNPADHLMYGAGSAWGSVKQNGD
jgi:gamma-glutamyltranspeptidase/glutathione hydrolase